MSIYTFKHVEFGQHLIAAVIGNHWYHHSSLWGVTATAMHAGHTTHGRAYDGDRVVFLEDLLHGDEETEYGNNGNSQKLSGKTGGRSTAHRV